MGHPAPTTTLATTPTSCRAGFLPSFFFFSLRRPCRRRDRSQKDTIPLLHFVFALDTILFRDNGRDKVVKEVLDT